MRSRSLVLRMTPPRTLPQIRAAARLAQPELPGQVAWRAWDPAVLRGMARVGWTTRARIIATGTRATRTGDVAHPASRSI